MAWSSMRHPNIHGRFLLVSVFLLLHGAAGFASAENGKPAEKTYPAFKYSETAAEPVIEYNLVHDMLAEPDPEPLLRVYGNGRVHVHYPVYMKKAGDYEIQLSKPELNALIRSLADNGIIDFDHGAAIAHRKQFEAQQRATKGTLYYVSDATETVLDIRLGEYQRSASDKRVINLKKRFTWKNLELDARRDKNNRHIQSAAIGINKLDNLMQHDSMRKIK